MTADECGGAPAAASQVLLLAGGDAGCRFIAPPPCRRRPRAIPYTEALLSTLILDPQVKLRGMDLSELYAGGVELTQRVELMP